jgi:hypothetical protein
VSFVIYDVAKSIQAGDLPTAAKTAGTAAAVRRCQRFWTVWNALHAPAGVQRGPGGKFIPGAPTALTRAAGTLSRAAGPAGVAVETVLGEGAAGHRADDPNETTAERQARFEQEYAALLEAKRNARPGSSEWSRIQERLGEMMSALGSGVRNRR